MAIDYRNECAVFSDVVGVEEADGLLEWLEINPGKPVVLEKCQHLHTAILQVLMMFKPPVSVFPANEELCSWLTELWPQNPGE